MNNPIPDLNSASYPGLREMAWFALRAKGLQFRRALTNVARGPSRMPPGQPLAFPYVLAQSVSPLDTGVDPRERPLLLGKYQNLRVACRRMHHRVLRAGDTFSFWRQVGPPWRWRGFVAGREVREGCVIPTTGGGLCQLSGSLLEVALQLGFDLIEHHRHTALPADVPHNERRDATLFWNYVDLRFRGAHSVLFETFLTADALVVRVRGESPRASRITPVPAVKPARSAPGREIQSCYVCGTTDCVRCQPLATSARRPAAASTAYLVDHYQPEFDRYIQARRNCNDGLLMPFTPGKDRRGWCRDGFASMRSIPGFRLQQSLLLRLAVARGVSVAHAHFALARSLARRFAARIDSEIEQLCLSQTLLPHLWQLGVLGGRVFDVLMYREPTALIERKLDDALRLYPNGDTLAEFRSPPGFAETELEALHAARTLITPHAQIASLFPNTTRLDWAACDNASAPVAAGAAKDGILFCGPTLARKGAHAVREAVRELGITLLVLGANHEDAAFWRGLPVVPVEPASLRWERVYAVVQPALFEYWPRMLLRAHAAGARLIISPGCGIAENRGAGIYHVPFGDPASLIMTLANLLPTENKFN